MGDKGGKKNKNKSQKQISEKLRHEDDNSIELHEKYLNTQELPSEKTAKKTKVVKALNENMKAVEKSDK